MNAISRLAFDRSERWTDQDGHLHVRVTNLSKATVNPYRGREIPGFDKLGLDPDRIYQMFRAPEELKKGAETFNNLRLMSRHVAVSADQPQEKLVAGSTGTDARFEHPYLVNSLVIWRREDIDDVESREKCELSCGYYYDPDMTPGSFEGQPYDGVMRNLRGNHVALVEAGRAGPDVMVHDQEMKRMPALSSRKALLVRGALTGYLAGKLQPGAGLALDEALANVSRKTWSEVKPKLIAAITEMATPKLAKDSKLDDLKQIMDWMDDEEDGEAEDDMLDAEDKEDDEDEMKAKEKKEADDKKAKDKAAKDKKAKDKKAMDKDEDEKKEDKAMDAATIEQRVIARMNAAIQARDDVRPVVGNVSLALDSAEKIYEYALKARKIDLTDVPASGYRAIFRALPKPQAAPALAMDAAVTNDLNAMFPQRARISQA